MTHPSSSQFNALQKKPWTGRNAGMSECRKVSHNEQPNVAKVGERGGWERGWGLVLTLLGELSPSQLFLQRNRTRQNSIPEHIIYKLLSKLEVPDITEAHHVEWICE